MLKTNLSSEEWRRILKLKVYEFKVEMTIDFHRLSVNQAEKLLNKIINGSSDILLILTIIHGYNNGIKLKEIVKNWNEPRIQNKTTYAHNPGRTTLLICKESPK